MMAANKLADADLLLSSAGGHSKKQGSDHMDDQARSGINFVTEALGCKNKFSFK